jgi:hypothetical protein
VQRFEDSLRDSGILTDEGFEQAKRKLIEQKAASSKPHRTFEEPLQGMRASHGD